MPGKRKRDEEEPYSQTVEGDSHHHGTTVFVSNLPYTATSTDLKTLFSDVAPVKNAFVVLEKESKVSKGVGYVTFAMQEDAQACVERQTIDMNGRALRIGWAGLKPKPGESSPLKTSKPPKTTNAPPKPKSLDPNAIRTIVITGLPNGVDSKVLWKKVRKQEGADTVAHPFTDPDGSEDATKAEVLFTTPAQAMHAIERLNAHVFKGSTLGVTLKKRMEKQPNRASRLIVRNLPWNTTESDLRTLFLPHGPIYSVEIPTESGDARRKPKAKGFAFVWMTSKIDAEKAIAGVNGKMLKERPIAVDWALSKSKWEGVKDQVEAEIDAQDQVEGEEGSDSEGRSENEELDDSSDEGLGVHADGDVSMHSGSEEDGEEDKEGDEDDRGSPSKPELPPPEAGTTLFIRNVPWEATEDDLRQLFKAFGSLRYVRIVMDHESGRSKGTAFACYWKKEDADKVAAISQTLSKDVNMVNGLPFCYGPD
ncbi:RNA recognition motif-containing protein [Serendipita sp. 398]|nr:RNA recognition motif-containing protein [Serendipita sp. 398]